MEYKAIHKIYDHAVFSQMIYWISVVDVINECQIDLHKLYEADMKHDIRVQLAKDRLQRDLILNNIDINLYNFILDESNKRRKNQKNSKTS